MIQKYCKIISYHILESMKNEDWENKHRGNILKLRNMGINNNI